MFLSGCLHRPLGAFDDRDWRAALERHDFWRSHRFNADEDHVGLAFHVLMNEGRLARGEDAPAADGFDAVPVPATVFEDAALCELVEDWSAMHAAECGEGLVVKMGVYVIHAGGTLGFHVDGPLLLRGQRQDLSSEPIQRAIVETHASRRTVLPLSFNADDRFMVCGSRVPLARGELFEFSNVLPHAYFNRGDQPAALLVTTYLVADMLPADMYVPVEPEMERAP